MIQRLSVTIVLSAMLLSVALAESGPVPRAALTSSIEDREPVDVVTHVPADSDHIYYFSEIHDQAGGTIIHRWLHEGQNYGDVRFDIGGDRWRVWSRKQLTEELRGDWRVQIVDSEGRVMRETRFTYGKRADEAQTRPAEAETDAAPSEAAPDPASGEDAVESETPDEDASESPETPADEQSEAGSEGDAADADDNGED